MGGTSLRGHPLAAASVTLAAGVGAAVAVFHQRGYNLAASEIFFEAALVGAPLGVGAAIRRRRELRGRLAERAQALAGEREERARAVLAAERRELAARLDAEVLADVEALERAAGGEAPWPLAEIEEIARRALDRLRQALTVLRAEVAAAPAAQGTEPAAHRRVPRGLWPAVACLIAAAVEIESLTSHLARGPVVAHVAVGCGLAVMFAVLLGAVAGRCRLLGAGLSAVPAVDPDRAAVHAERAADHPALRGRAAERAARRDGRAGGVRGRRRGCSQRRARHLLQ